MAKKLKGRLIGSVDLTELVDVAYWTGYYDGLKHKVGSTGKVKGKKGYSVSGKAGVK